jgi:ketosteroid isomerase-like protein
MSEENVELAGQFYDAWNRGDLDWIADRVTDDFELRPVVGFLDLEEVYRGRDGWERFARTWLQAWVAATIELERVEDLGDRLLVLLTSNATGQGSGVSVRMRFGHLVTLRDQQVASLVVIEGWDRALEAAGLRE